MVIDGGGGNRPVRIVRTARRDGVERIRTMHAAANEAVSRRDHASWVNPYSGLGTIQDRASQTQFEGGSPQSRGAVDALMEFNAIARRIVWREPEDGVREGFDLKGDYTPEQLEAINESVQSLGLMGIVAKGRAFARASGGAGALLLADDGHKNSEPLDFTSLECLDRIEVVDRHDLTPIAWGRDPTRKKTWGKPILYQYHIHTGGPVVGSGTVHHSRVVRFEGLELPPRVQSFRHGWGGSVMDLVWSELRNSLSSHQFAAEAVSLVTQAVYKLGGLGESAMAGEAEAIADRLEAIQLSQGILGGIVIGDSEEYSVIERTFSGLADLLDRLTGMLIAASEMPKTILMGEQPSGLNANGDSEIQGWYDHVASLQDPFYTPPLMRILEVLLRCRLGPTGGHWDPKTTVDWKPLWQQTEQEKAQTNLTNAQANALLRSSGTISPEESRLQPWLIDAYPGFDPAAPPPPSAAPSGAPGLEDAEDGVDVHELPEPIIAADDSEMVNGEQLVAAAAVAQFLGVSRSTVMGMARESRFPAYRVGQRWRFQMSQVRAGVSSGRMQGARGDQAPLH